MVSTIEDLGREAGESLGTSTASPQFEALVKASDDLKKALDNAQVRPRSLADQKQCVALCGHGNRNCIICRKKVSRGGENAGTMHVMKRLLSVAFGIKWSLMIGSASRAFGYALTYGKVPRDLCKSCTAGRGRRIGGARGKARTDKTFKRTPRSSCAVRTKKAISDGFENFT